MIFMNRRKTAIVFFNLGGPDRPAAVKPFLFNLFNDPAIITLPGPLRWILAKFISGKRAPIAQEIYAELGGASPLLAQTEAQARGLEAVLADDDGSDYRVFVSMRYWHPMSDAAAAEVAAWAPDQIVLLPLYPQFSTTTTESSIRDWSRAAHAAGLNAPTSVICCYPRQKDYVAAQARLLRRELKQTPGPVRVLFSAHGLPKKFIDDGDPYQWQIEQCALGIAREADLGTGDFRVCYQSRVGRLEWIGPSLDEALDKAAQHGVNVVVMPISFVSEHSETLVELDIEYKKIATDFGIEHYRRVPTLTADAGYMNALASLAREAATKRGLCPPDGSRYCPQRFDRCLCREN
jgi:protoporphyrin/coproporphyrin ferrochelatase